MATTRTSDEISMPVPTGERAAPRVKGENPFPGLRPFKSSESRLFFGRDGQSDQLLDKLVRTRFVAVVGISGSGKSSLVRAGLLPALYSGITLNGSGWKVAVFRPGGAPLANLAKALVRSSRPDPEDEGEEGWDESSELEQALIETTLRRSSMGLVEATRQMKRDRECAPDNLLVVVDQFEETFRYSLASGDRNSKDEAAAFVNLLLAAAKGQKEVPIYVVLTMRSEYLAECAHYWGLPEAISAGQYLIPRMSRDERRQAIIGPVGVAGGEISPPLVNRLLNAVGDSPSQLPILQHVLMRIWTDWKARGGAMMDLNNYEHVGGIAQALSRHGRQVYENLPTGRSRMLAKNMFQAIVETGKGEGDNRRPMPLALLCKIVKATREELEPIINDFREPDVSFLTPPRSVELRDNTVIDISHESLISGWRQLQEWAKEEAESARIYKRLAETATLHKRAAASLYVGRDLRRALFWRRKYDPSPEWGKRYDAAYEDAIRFLNESSRRRTYRVLVSFMIFVVIALVAAYYNESWKSIARSRQLVNDSKKVLEENPEKGLSLALDAVHAYPIDEAEEALRNALFKHSTRVVIQPVEQTSGRPPLTSAVYSPVPNNKFILLSSKGGQAETWTWNAEDGAAQRVATFARHRAPLTGAAFNAAGDRIVTTSADNTAIVWAVNPQTGGNEGLVAELNGHSKTVNSAAFSPDGRYVVTASSDGTARVWSLSDGRAVEVALLGPPTDRVERTNAPWVKSAAFSPDGRFIMTADWDGNIRVWSATFGAGTVREIETPSRHHQNGLNSAVFSDDGKYVLTASNDATAIIFAWDAAAGKLGRPLALLPHDGPVLKAAFNAKDPYFVVTACGDSMAHVWRWSEERADGEQPRRANSSSSVELGNVSLVERARRINSLRGHTDWVNSAVFSSDGRYVLTAGDDGIARVWVPAKNEQEPLQQEFRDINGTVLATSGDGARRPPPTAGGAVHLWDGSYNKRPQLLPPVSNVSFFAAFDTSGQRLIVLRNYEVMSDGIRIGEKREASMWDVSVPAQPKELFQPLTLEQGTPFYNAAISPDGARFIITSSNQGVSIYNIITSNNQGRVVFDELTGLPVPEPLAGKPLILKQGDGTYSVYGVAFSPDGKHVVTANSDHTARIYNAANGDLEFELRGHTEAVRSAAFSPDGNFLATTGDDGMVRLWRWQAGSPAGAPLPYGEMKAYEDVTQQGVSSVSFSVDSKYLVTTGNDDTVRVWYAATGAQLMSMREDKTGIESGGVNLKELPTSASAIQRHPRRLLRGASFDSTGQYLITFHNGKVKLRKYLWRYFRPLDDLRRQAEKFVVR